MEPIVKKSIEELNEILPKEKKLIVDESTPLIDEHSNLESIDLVNLFVNLEKNLKKKGRPTLTFDEILKSADQLKTIGSLEVFLNNKLKNKKK
jgi:acyl carrier protein|tara:strand:+ start:1833 stop:2111 length:279 start_codon:yes stop_codon:yes gene_type:complete